MMAKRGRAPRPRDASPHVRADEPGPEIMPVKFFVLAAMFAAGLIVTVPPTAHAGSCQTHCYWIGNQQYCNTYCY